jgi:aspartate aminotransferase
MKLSSRVKEVNPSITLKLNAKAQALAEEGKQIFNLTAGQLPYRPMSEFVDLIRSESDFLKSFQYSPVAGFPELRKKILAHFEESRKVSLESSGVEFDCLISNGGKHALSNVLGSLIDHGDEVIILSPYWVSYPEMVKFCKGVPVIVSTTSFDLFVPSLDEIKRNLSPKTKAIIVNSPNNPSGIHYNDEWMKGFAEIMLENPDVAIISDEIYFELSYYDPKPTYFYQHYPELLKQTVIIDGISKTLACTGLRIGYIIAPKELTNVVSNLQGQTTSGANSLVQRALVNFDFNQIPVYLTPIKKHLRENAEALGDAFRDHKMTHIFYQPLSAFYYFIDFTQTKVLEMKKEEIGEKEDYSFELCEDILEKYGVALVPGMAFGVPNTARMSLVLEKSPFKESIDRIMKFLLGE